MRGRSGLERCTLVKVCVGRGGRGGEEQIADIYNRGVYHCVFIPVSSFTAVPSEWEEKWNSKASQNRCSASQSSLMTTTITHFYSLPFSLSSPPPLPLSLPFPSLPPLTLPFPSLSSPSPPSTHKIQIWSSTLISTSLLPTSSSVSETVLYTYSQDYTQANIHSNRLHHEESRQPCLKGTYYPCRVGYSTHPLLLPHVWLVTLFLPPRSSLWWLRSVRSTDSGLNKTLCSTVPEVSHQSELLV